MCLLRYIFGSMMFTSVFRRTSVFTRTLNTQTSSAVADACRQLNERLAPFKEQLPEGTFREVVNAAYFERVDLSAHGFYKTPDVTGFGGVLPFNYFTFGASCSEVELDTLTGDFHLLRSDLCMDVGQSLNPAIDIGQVRPSLAPHFMKCFALGIHRAVLSTLVAKTIGGYPAHSAMLRSYASTLTRSFPRLP